MGIRREQPAVERSGDSITVRLGDGSVRAMPVDRSRGPVSSDLCCFCGRSVEPSDGQSVRLAVQWSEEGQERSQSWDAHRNCFVERMDPGVAGTGPFFGG